jgi:thiol-disulfide isomerase/thioredoxin
MVSNTDGPDPGGDPGFTAETADLGTRPDRKDGAGGFPAKIGPYVIKRVIASGGMGTVYEAVQENPRRPAAVKVIKHTMASGDALRRFEREAQALARLRHPGIAQIYEAGTFVEAGVSLPFFALEYIPNARTIIAYAKAKGLDLRGKLDLFLQVCDAVHYGHQRGIIHRDLKPGNILVDSQGRVRVIDFGVARAVDADLEQVDHQTQVGQIIGTAQYMSPEQFEADPNDLDTRSDVYALGVVLYELLADRLPYPVEHSGIFEIARIVREEEPAALSRVLPGVGEEIEAIAAKALQKDRERRFQSAFGLAEDLRRFLRGEAVSAKPASLAYQVKVFARKNKAVVGLASAAAVLLIVGMAVTAKLYVDVNAARDRAEVAAAKAIAANEFLKSTLAAVVPPGFGDVRTIGDLCDRVALDLDTAFPDSPGTEADIRNTIGHIYYRLDKRPQAEQQLIRAHALRRDNLGPTAELTLEALHDLNYFYYVFGPPAKNVATSREYFAMVSRSYAPEQEEVLEARWLIHDALIFAGDFERAEQVARDLRTDIVRLHGQESADGLSALTIHAMGLLMIGRLDEAGAAAHEAFALSASLPTAGARDVRYARSTYAAALLSAGEIDQAKSLYGHRRAPDLTGVQMAYQGSLGDLNRGVKILVMFETWCPFSQRYIPKMEKISRQYGDLDVLALTRTNRSSSDDRVRQFIQDNRLSFSVLKESGRTWNYFEATGTPFTVILHDGEVIWKSSGDGNIPGRLVEGILKQG